MMFSKLTQAHQDYHRAIQEHQKAAQSLQTNHYRLKLTNLSLEFYANIKKTQETERFHAELEYLSEDLEKLISQEAEKKNLCEEAETAYREALEEFFEERRNNP